jgi:hypothetical protein
MDFNWRGAVDLNCDNLLDIAFRLVTMAGILGMRTVSTLPRHLYFKILAILRPAEFATRRLILAAAWRLNWQGADKPGPQRKRKKDDPADQREPDSGLPLTSEETGSGLPLTNEETGDTRDGTPDDAEPRPPTFQIFDPWKNYGSPWLTEEQVARLENPGARPAMPAKQLPPDEPVDAKSLCRRIRALANALGDLDWHALRLARWRARMNARCWTDPDAPRLRPHRTSPMRPGLPPGYKKRPKTPVEAALHECHGLALYALAPPDT